MKKYKCAVALTLPLLLACSAGGAQSSDKAFFDTADQTIVKRSRQNICHDRTHAKFKETLHFRAYRTMQDCLDSGGERAKK
ncbi:MAG TPA: hypothetical protein VFR59_13505 [Steroidobacteraceae bacterium]|nr:hypothetical protein [Steroidobacteraceae bacterium]